jgi:hypothetical protein
MDNQFDGIEVFEGKKLSDLLKDIYVNHEDKKSQIKELVSDLQPLIEGIGDATLLVPLIAQYVELGIKNDEQLVKLAQVVQRIDAAKKIGAKADSFNFDDLQDMLVQDQNLNGAIKETKATEESLVPKKPVIAS